LDDEGWWKGVVIACRPAEVLMSGMGCFRDTRTQTQDASAIGLCD
jgi:hypothetical protein